MKTGLLSLLAGTALMGGVAIAQAGEVTTLDNSQLDGVVAGDTVSIAATRASGITTASGQTGTSNVSFFGVPTSSSGGTNNGNLTTATANPTLGGTVYTIVHTAP